MSNTFVVTRSRGRIVQDEAPSRARSAARASRKAAPISTVVGCAPPSKRRAIRSVSSSVVTASANGKKGELRRMRDEYAALKRDLADKKSRR